MNTNHVITRKISQKNRLKKHRQDRSRKKRKLLVAFIWAIILAFYTSVNNLEDLLALQSVTFKWNTSPDYASFFHFLDITKIHRYFVFVKVGHFIGFAILDLLLFNWLQNHKKSIFISITFAFLTEFFQFYLGRDGRLYDLIIDSLGVITVFLLIKIIRK
ncbi:VanZ family protein [Bacillus sp. 03113]|uniref:VanZ family protein n=1 Tax=Bacillus sp. 03113 TaxID=2578211 RepID=UPI001143A106|nr:VanZ family protein [Bacillus sp. 03113]